MKDEIIEELWQVKDSIAERHGHDVDELVAYLRASPDERVQPAKAEESDPISDFVHPR